MKGENMEIWKPCKENDVYQLSNEGRIRNRRTGRVLKTQINKNGYEVLSIVVDGRSVTRRLHRLIADAFYDGEHDGLDVNHDDGNKRNNNIENLEFCTRQENIIHAHRLGLNCSHKKKKVRIVETGEMFDSVTECGEALGVTRHAVGKCVNGQVNTCRGYHIEFV